MGSIAADSASNDVELVRALRDGDERAFDALVARYHTALVRLATVYVGDRSEAEDVAQEAWVGMLRGIDGFAGRASLRTWLFHILVNCARASRRHGARALTFSDLGNIGAGEPPSVEPQRFHPDGHRWAGHWSVPPCEWPEERLLAAETLEHVQRAMQSLPTRQRVVLILRDVEGWTAADVGAVLGISDANERVLLHRARSHIRRQLETYLTQPDGDAR